MVRVRVHAGTAWQLYYFKDKKRVRSHSNYLKSKYPISLTKNCSADMASVVSTEPVHHAATHVAMRTANTRRSVTL